MKNFKKIIVVLLVLILALAVFVACDDEEHTHSYTKWGYNATSHWMCCPDDGKIDTETIAAHVFATGSDVCSVCGYDKNGGNNGGDWYDYDLSEVLGVYADSDNWNFQVVYDIYYDSMTTPDYTYVYGYKDAFTVSIAYEEDGEDYIDYYSYDDGMYYYDNGDGTHSAYGEDSEYWDDLLYTAESFDISGLKDLTFTHFDGKSNVTFTDTKYNQYVASNAVAAGNAIFGEWENSSDEQGAWTKVELYLQGDTIYQIVAYAEGSYNYLGDEYDFNDKYVLTFSKFGEIDFDLDDLTVVDGEDGEDTGATYTAVFTDKKFSNESGLTFTSSRTPDNYGNSAVQFYQSKGSATVTTSGLENVTSVTVVMFTNSDTKKTYTVSIKVGDTTLTCDGNATVTVNQNTDMSITFTSADGVDGDVSISLTPSGSSGSMWLKSVEIVCGNGGGNGTIVKPIPTETMPAQTYVASKLDKSTLQEAMNAWSTKNNYDPCIGIQSNPWKSNSSYTETRCLVVPVEFSDASFESGQIDKLKLAFNGTETDTGWQSVNSYYKKSSYGKLNLQYDFVAEPYKSSHTASYYEDTNFGTYRDGSTALLEEIMAKYDSTIDFSKYDTNGDDFIDAIYIIYACDVDYDDADLYWAFVTQYYPENENDEKAYDNKYLGYYLFAGVNFIYEFTGATDDYYKDRDDLTISGLKINASTFIHETGHLLDLDDYYDYNSKLGSNNGLGGADMMDYTVGDHNAYSKMMLGWIEPTIVTTTQTVTINTFESSGDCIMLLLDYDDSYFGEYLLIDLYANTGLNQMHANQGSSYLYYDSNTRKGAEYGVRIYHVSSDISNPYSDDNYSSFTTNNNSSTTDALIKLVQADGEADFSNDEYGLCSAADLWQAGDKLSEVFPNYARNDNKKVNFDIEIVSVSKTQATITITFNA